MKIRFLCPHELSITFPWWPSRGFKLFLSLQNVKTNQNFRISVIFTIHTYQCQSLRCVFLGSNLSLFLIPVQFNGMYIYKRPSSLLSAVYVFQSFQMLLENKKKRLVTFEGNIYPIHLNFSWYFYYNISCFNFWYF